MVFWFIIFGIAIATCCLSRIFVVDGYTLNDNVPTMIGNNLNRRDVLSASAGCCMSGLMLPSVDASAIESAKNSNNFVLLNDESKTKFPLVSFGVQIYDDDTAYKLTLIALEVGYRNFFASVLAGNQRGFAKAIRDSQIPRNELFICGSVVSNRVQGFDNAKRSTTTGWNKNLEAFSVGNIDYLDQIMLDYPGPDNESIRGQWSSFIDMMEQKYTKTLAVSNFSPQQLQPIVNQDDPTIRRYNPVVNQLPLSVAYHPGNVIADNANLGVVVQAWAPLGGSLGGRFDAPKMDTCQKIGSTYNKSGSQVALRWIIQKGGSICTQTKKREHFIEDLNIFDFTLSAADMAVLDLLA
jgi:diketogulonate reductase-like aldo/keto reductase